MYLGLDLGTSELKALLLADDHRVVAVARASLTVQRPRPLWSEQDPAQWWQACEQVLDELAASHGAALRQVRALGLSGQMHGAVLLDSQDQVLRPAILWNDGRSAQECAQLTEAVPALTEIAGNLAMPGFTAPKLLWVREHEPDVFAKTARVLLPKDYLRLRLTGEAVSDVSDASGTLWLDVGQRRWSEVLLEACGLTVAHMPRLVEGSEVGATLRSDIARRWGLTPGIPVAGGGGDNAASAVGMGVVEPGQGFVSLGTSGVIFVSTDQYLPNPAQAMHAFCHALPGRWHQMSVMLSAASALSWASSALGFEDVAALLAQAQTLSVAQREQAPWFLPYLSGERSPHNDPKVQASWVGLTHAHDRGALAYAVVEGVSFGLLDGFRTLALPPDAPVESLSLVGGGARSTWWGQVLASTLGVPLKLHESAEAGGALGAARLAWLADLGAQEAERSQSDVCQSPAVRQWLEPDAGEQARLLARHARFGTLYADLKSHFQQA